MDLGAPILDVATTTAAGEDKVISDGVVTAPGYEPLIITPTTTNKDKGIDRNNLHETFKPDVDIQRKDVNKIDTVTVEQEKIIAAKNGGATGDGNTVIIVDKDNTALMIVLIAIILLGVIGILLCIRFMIYQSKKDFIEAQRRKERKLEFDIAEMDESPTRVHPDTNLEKRHRQGIA